MRYLLAFALAAAYLPAADSPLLPQRPALSKTHIVFSYAGDLWSVSRQGGEAIRLTSAPGAESNAVFTPDGKTIIFSGSYDGNPDIFSVPASGGIPKRLTWHPGPDVPVAVSPDGKSILFNSPRASATRGAALYTMDINGGGLAATTPFPIAHAATYSPDGTRIAYTPIAPPFTIWKRYRGGQTSKIWLANLSDSRVEEIPRNNSNDFNPLWSGERVYFLSDRNGTMALFYYDLKSKKVVEAAKNSGFDYKSASLGPDAIVLERFGGIELYDLKSGKITPINITVAGDIPGIRPYLDKVARRINYSGISPTGARAVFEARGEILTVPAEKGDVRNLTNSSGVADRFPSWSPDGKEIAYFSDESGEYQLHVKPQNGMGEPKKFDIGWKAFFYTPIWSPDGKKILFRDSMLNVCYIDLESKKVTKIDADYYDSPFRDEVNPSWSPDSKWILYTKELKNHLRAVHVFSLDSTKSTQLSDGLSDARHARFDKNGKFAYFTASTNQGLATGWLDMTAISRVQNRSAYLMVLSSSEPSPLAPESDEEKADAEKKDDKKEPEKKESDKADKKDDKKAVEVKIDFDGISQRILSLPVPAANYSQLEVGKSGVVFLVEAPPVDQDGPPKLTVHKFDLKTRKAEKFLDGVASLDVSFNGEKALVRQGERWFITATGAPPKPGEGTLKTDQMEVRVDPPAEWKQMYREVWRIERDFLYDPNAHGLNLAEAEKRYEPYLGAVAHRGDLNYLFGEMLGNLVLGHTYVGGGAFPDVKTVPGGLLGADYVTENGRYKFSRVFDGENWNPSLRAPLTQPGVNVKAGEYLLAVNGRDVRATDDVFSFFEATSGKSVTLKVGPNANGDGSRDVIVVPIGNEQGLRYMAWVEDNRRKVDQLSGGRLGYVHLPNTADAGFTNFNRWFFAQVGKEGMVLDERFNGGGSIADYIVDYLNRPLLAYFTTRAGNDFTVPMNAIFGPKAMIVNEFAGSGGDAMPWMFRKLKIGPLVGKRTWGGLVGIFGFPQLVDGGFVTAPNLAFYNTEKQWDVENFGVAPDIEVEQDPALVRQGKDPQLEKTVEILLEQLRKNPLPKHEKPAYPNYYKK
jgi:tricorn protease